jgi:hypothetical protein
MTVTEARNRAVGMVMAALKRQGRVALHASAVNGVPSLICDGMRIAVVAGDGIGAVAVVDSAGEVRLIELHADA